MDKRLDSFSAGLELYCRGLNAKYSGEPSFRLGVLSSIVIDLLDGDDSFCRRNAKTTLVTFLLSGEEVRAAAIAKAEGVQS